MLVFVFVLLVGKHIILFYNNHFSNKNKSYDLVC